LTNYDKNDSINAKEIGFKKREEDSFCRIVTQGVLFLKGKVK